jgi:hypothetical protein
MFNRRPVWGLAAVVIGGLIVGTTVDRFPIGVVARSIVAMVIAWHASLVLVSFVLLLRSPYAGEVGAPSANLKSVWLTTLAAIAGGALLHYAVSWEGIGISQEVLRYRTEGIGVAGFLAGSIQAAVACGIDT